MNFKTTLDILMKNGKVEVKEKLTSGQRKAVDKGYAIMKAYQDQPSNISYMFRPIKYFLIISDWYEWELKSKEDNSD